MRDQIYKQVQSIRPLDELENNHKQDCLNWIESGVELCRISKPDNPPIHLVSYFVLVDGDAILLVDHINAQLWLPTGGHVDVGEHPKLAAIREAKEELGINAELVFEHPIFITVTDTVGLTAGHTDVSLWYVLKGSREKEYVYDQSEFKQIKWFKLDEIPLQKSEPNITRFLQKLALMKDRHIYRGKHEVAR